MAIVTAFFDQQKAGEINAIINNNFTNVAKYIPVHFDTMTTVDRLNLGADWKTDGKLVYDIDDDLVYIWDEASVEWVQKLLEARDSYARAISEELQERCISKIELTSDCKLIFKNVLDQKIGEQLLSADKLQYDSSTTIQQKIQELIQKDTQLQQSIDTINETIGSVPMTTTAQTLTGAIEELHTELTKDTEDLGNILDGTTPVPEAVHTQQADNASDSEKLGGELPAFYAKQSDMDTANQNIADNASGVTQNAESIVDLQEQLNTTNATVEANKADCDATKEVVVADSERIDILETSVSNLKGSIIPKGSVADVESLSHPEGELSTEMFKILNLEYVWLASTKLTEGSEAEELAAQYPEASANSAVINTENLDVWVYSGSAWENQGVVIEQGWALRDNATYDMWVFDNVTALWVNFGGSYEIQIANKTKAGIVKASDDVNVGADGSMTIPQLSNLLTKVDGVTQAQVVPKAPDTGLTLNLQNSEGTVKSSVNLDRKALAHKIQGTGDVLSDKTTLQFTGNVIVSEDIDNDKILVNILGGEETVVNVSLVDTDYTIEITESTATYKSPALEGYNSATDTIKVFMNGGYIPKSNYSIEVADTKIATITNLNHDTNPWQVGWEITLLVTRVVTTVS